MSRRSLSAWGHALLGDQGGARVANAEPLADTTKEDLPTLANHVAADLLGGKRCRPTAHDESAAGQALARIVGRRQKVARPRAGTNAPKLWPAEPGKISIGVRWDYSDRSGSHQRANIVPTVRFTFPTGS